MEKSFEIDLGGLHLVIALPAYDGKVPTDQMVSLINTMTLCRQYGVATTVDIRAGSALIEKARAELLHKFIAHTDGTHLLFLDSDIVWQPEDAIRLLSFCTEYDSACGPYCTKEPEPDFHYTLAEGPGGRVVQNEHGLVKLLRAPLGFNCFRRSALEKVVAANQDLCFVPKRGDFKDESLCGVFATEIRPDEDGIARFYGEDIAFYRRFIDAGCDAWLDPAIVLTHVGKKDYSSRYLDWVRRKNAAKHSQEVSEAA